MASRASGSIAVAALVVVVVVVLVFLTVGFISTKTPAPSESLQIQVAPNAIPVSGSWNVTSSLYFPNNSTRFLVNAAITMTAVMSDSSKTVSEMTAKSGEATFAVLPGTVAVTFSASYLNYSASFSVSSTKVVGWKLATAALVAPSGTSTTAALISGIRGSDPRYRGRLAGAIASNVAALSLPVAYMIQVYPTWYGTGWAPVYYLGLPVWTFTVIAFAVGIPSVLLLKPKPG